MRSDFEASLEEEDDLILEQPVANESHRAVDFFLVGRFLTNQTINFNAMKNRLADIWKLVKGVTIKSIGQGRRQIGNFLGSFVEYDKSNSIGAWRNYMQIRVIINVSLPLKHFKSIRGGEGGSFWITFKYERLSTFYFVCGRIGHAESFCELRYARGWDISLRAHERRFGVGASSRWLKDGQTQEHGNVGGGSVDTPNVGVHGDSGTRERSEQVNGGNLAMALTTVGTVHNNLMYEEGGMHGIYGLSDLELQDERKRKRGNMIMGTVPVRSTDDTNEHFLEVGPSYGACPE
ncbi:hypothetical protein ACS0TY_023571 [Phlomoides rotata]